jgi:hypothetical protein
MGLNHQVANRPLSTRLSPSSNHWPAGRFKEGGECWRGWIHGCSFTSWSDLSFRLYAEVATRSTTTRISQPEVDKVSDALHYLDNGGVDGGLKLLDEVELVAVE